MKKYKKDFNDKVNEAASRPRLDIKKIKNSADLGGQPSTFFLANDVFTVVTLLTRPDEGCPRIQIRVKKSGPLVTGVQVFDAPFDYEFRTRDLDAIKKSGRYILSNFFFPVLVPRSEDSTLRAVLLGLERTQFLKLCEMYDRKPFHQVGCRRTGFNIQFTPNYDAPAPDKTFDQKANGYLSWAHDEWKVHEHQFLQDMASVYEQIGQTLEIGESK